MKIKPAAGRAVRDPAKGTLLPEDGAVVEIDAFWRRRLQDGDVEIVTLDSANSRATIAAVTTSTLSKTDTP